eukprot:gene10092-11944_t
MGRYSIGAKQACLSLANVENGETLVESLSIDSTTVSTLRFNYRDIASSSDPTWNLQGQQRVNKEQRNECKACMEAIKNTSFTVVEVTGLKERHSGNFDVNKMKRELKDMYFHYIENEDDRVTITVSDHLDRPGQCLTEMVDDSLSKTIFAWQRVDHGDCQRCKDCATCCFELEVEIHAHRPADLQPTSEETGTESGATAGARPCYCGLPKCNAVVSASIRCMYLPSDLQDEQGDETRKHVERLVVECATDDEKAEHADPFPAMWRTRVEREGRFLPSDPLNTGQAYIKGLTEPDRQKPGPYHRVRTVIHTHNTVADGKKAALADDQHNRILKNLGYPKSWKGSQTTDPSVLVLRKKRPDDVYGKLRQIHSQLPSPGSGSAAPRGKARQRVVADDEGHERFDAKQARQLFKFWVNHMHTSCDTDIRIDERDLVGIVLPANMDEAMQEAVDRDIRLAQPPLGDPGKGFLLDVLQGIHLGSNYWNVTCSEPVTHDGAQDAPGVALDSPRPTRRARKTTAGGPLRIEVKRGDHKGHYTVTHFVLLRTGADDYVPEVQSHDACRLLAWSMEAEMEAEMAYRARQERDAALGPCTVERGFLTLNRGKLLSAKDSLLTWQPSPARWSCKTPLAEARYEARGSALWEALRRRNVQSDERSSLYLRDPKQKVRLSVRVPRGAPSLEPIEIKVRDKGTRGQFAGHYSFQTPRLVHPGQYVVRVELSHQTANEEAGPSSQAAARPHPEVKALEFRYTVESEAKLHPDWVACVHPGDCRGARCAQLQKTSHQLVQLGEDRLPSVHIAQRDPDFGAVPFPTHARGGSAAKYQLSRELVAVEGEEDGWRLKLPNVPGVLRSGGGELLLPGDRVHPVEREGKLPSGQDSAAPSDVQLRVRLVNLSPREAQEVEGTDYCVELPIRLAPGLVTELRPMIMDDQVTEIKAPPLPQGGTLWTLGRMPSHGRPLGLRVHVLDRWGNRTRQGLRVAGRGSVLTVELKGLGFNAGVEGSHKDMPVDETGTLDLAALVVHRRADRRVELNVKLSPSEPRPLLTLKGELPKYELALMEAPLEGGPWQRLLRQPPLTLRGVAGSVLTFNGRHLAAAVVTMPAGEIDEDVPETHLSVEIAGLQGGPVQLPLQRGRCRLPEDDPRLCLPDEIGRRTVRLSVERLGIQASFPGLQVLVGAGAAARVEPHRVACHSQPMEDGWGVAELKFKAFDVRDHRTQLWSVASLGRGAERAGHLEVREPLEDLHATTTLPPTPTSIQLFSTDIRPEGDALAGLKVRLSGPPRSVKLVLCHVADGGAVTNLCSKDGAAGSHWTVAFSSGPAVTGTLRIGGFDGGTGGEAAAEVADCTSLSEVTLELKDGRGFPACDWEGATVALQARVDPARAAHTEPALKLPPGRHEVAAKVQKGVAHFVGVVVDLLGAELRLAGHSADVLLLTSIATRTRERREGDPQVLRTELRIRVRPSNAVPRTLEVFVEESAAGLRQLAPHGELRAGCRESGAEPMLQTLWCKVSLEGGREAAGEDEVAALWRDAAPQLKLHREAGAGRRAEQEVIATAEAAPDGPPGGTVVEAGAPPCMWFRLQGVCWDTVARKYEVEFCCGRSQFTRTPAPLLQAVVCVEAGPPSHLHLHEQYPPLEMVPDGEVLRSTDPRLTQWTVAVRDAHGNPAKPRGGAKWNIRLVLLTPGAPSRPAAAVLGLARVNDRGEAELLCAALQVPEGTHPQKYQLGAELVDAAGHVQLSSAFAEAGPRVQVVDRNAMAQELEAARREAEIERARQIEERALREALGEAQQSLQRRQVDLRNAQDCIQKCNTQLECAQLAESATMQFEALGRNHDEYPQLTDSWHVRAYREAVENTDPAYSSLYVCMVREKLYTEQEDVGRAVVAYLGPSVLKALDRCRRWRGAVDTKHPQKPLVGLTAPNAPDPGTAGFLGFAVNLMRLDSRETDLRKTLMYHLLGDAMVFENTEASNRYVQSLPQNERHPVLLTVGRKEADRWTAPDVNRGGGQGVIMGRGQGAQAMKDFGLASWNWSNWAAPTTSLLDPRQSNVKQNLWSKADKKSTIMAGGQEVDNDATEIDRLDNTAMHACKSVLLAMAWFNVNAMPFVYML